MPNNCRKAVPIIGFSNSSGWSTEGIVAPRADAPVRRRLKAHELLARRGLPSLISVRLLCSVLPGFLAAASARTKAAFFLHQCLLFFSLLEISGGPKKTLVIVSSFLPSFWKLQAFSASGGVECHA